MPNCVPEIVLIWIRFSSAASKEWHPTGKDRIILCTECCSFYRKYGELRPLPEPQEPSSFLFKPVKEEEVGSTEKQGVRTRRSKEGVCDQRVLISL